MLSEIIEFVELNELSDLSELIELIELVQLVEQIELTDRLGKHKHTLRASLKHERSLAAGLKTICPMR